MCSVWEGWYVTLLSMCFIKLLYERGRSLTPVTKKKNVCTHLDWALLRFPRPFLSNRLIWLNLWVGSVKYRLKTLVLFSFRFLSLSDLLSPPWRTRNGSEHASSSPAMAPKWEPHPLTRHLLTRQTLWGTSASHSRIWHVVISHHKGKGINLGSRSHPKDLQAWWV